MRAFAIVSLLGLAGCNQRLPEGTIVITQTPVYRARLMPTRNLMDQRYPNGSRVALISPPYQYDKILVLSHGLIAAGEPVVSSDGDRIIFSGKRAEKDDWEIYQADLSGGRPIRLTTIEGGAMNPSIMPAGDVVFSSPVPTLEKKGAAGPTTALYAQFPAATPKRLTFGSNSASEPTVLSDGRILFVSTRAIKNSNAASSLGLFTINNDGTEVTSFALDRDGAAWIRRPRELPAKRVAFLASPSADAAGLTVAEMVRTARPFASRSPLFAFTGRCFSVEPEDDDALLACLDTSSSIGRLMNGSAAVYRIRPEATSRGLPLFDDPTRDEIEAVPLRKRVKAMGHLSVMCPTNNTGTILCLDARFTREMAKDPPAAKAAQRIRILAADRGRSCAVLGEVPLQTDGSFQAEVPADTPIGFESLDEEGTVLQRLPPSIWVRPGENRSCLGCHEPYNHTPRNVRPLAALHPPFSLGQRFNQAPTK